MPIKCATKINIYVVYVINFSGDKYVKLVERIGELEKEFELNRERIREYERRQIIVEYELTALKMMNRDLLSYGIEDCDL